MRDGDPNQSAGTQRSPLTRVGVVQHSWSWEKMQMRTTLVLGVLACGICAPAFAGTVAYWRWETGPANTNVIHTLAPGQFEGTIPDVSGNGNTLSVWEQGGGAGYQYRSDVPFSTVPGTG